MIKGFLLKHDNLGVIQVYKSILGNGLFPDNYTLPYTLKACANLRSSIHGGSVHGQCLKLGLQSDNFVGNSLIAVYSATDEMGAARLAFEEISLKCVVSWTVLISGYAKNGDVYAARLVFDEAPSKDRGIWGAMISGYVQNNCFKEGLKLFRLMQLSGIRPDEASLVSVLSACANLGCLEIGKWIHRYVEKVEMAVGLRLGTALIDMYSKCGCLDLADKVFDKMRQRDVICYNAMISAYAMNGDGGSALDLFDEMQEAQIKPDSITFISLFTACSYSNMAHQGLRLLHLMCNVYRIEPRVEHYGCIIDLLTRAKLIEEANAIVQKMPISNPSSSKEEAIAWRALLSGFCSHGHVELAEAAAEKLVKMERHSGAYVLLSNAYAVVGRHNEARSIRKTMRRRGVEKTPGCSSVEIESIVHEFVAGEKTHSKMDEICAVLDVMKKHSEFDSSFVL